MIFLFRFEKSLGRGSQSKPNNQTTYQQKTIPSLQSSFRKQEESIENEKTSTSTNNKNQNECTKEKQTVSVKSDDDNDSDDGEMPRPSFALNSSSTEQFNEFMCEKPQQQPSNTYQAKPKHLQQRIVDTGFIVYETLPQNGQQQQQQSVNILQVSAAKQGATVKCDVEVSKINPNTLECVVRINDTIYGSAPITNGKKEAKIQAFDDALKYARKIHYTIKVNKKTNFIAYFIFN